MSAIDPPRILSRREWKHAPGDLLAAFQAHGCFFLAAGISFYFMLSLVPILFFFLAVIGYFLQGSATVRDDLLAAITQYVPFISKELIRNIDQVVRNPGLLGWIGGAGLFLSTDLVFVAIQSSLDKIFVPGRRSFLKSKMLSVGLAVVVFIVILATIAVNAVDQSLENLESLTGRRGGLPVGLHLSTWAIGPLLVICFTLAIRMLPHVAVPFRYAVWGALVGAGLWMLVKGSYAWYLVNVSRVGPIFGSLGALILTMIWVYASSLAFLIGAEFTRWLILTDPKRVLSNRTGAEAPDGSEFAPARSGAGDPLRDLPKAS
jgi:membrane protein